MTTIQFEPEGFEELAGRLRGAETAGRIIMNEGLREIGGFMVPLLKAHTPVGATSKLRNTTVFQLQVVGQEQVLQIRQGARTSGGAFYGRFVRGGRKPGRQPPIAALLPWVIKVLGVSGPRARSVAFLVGRAIGRRGIKPNPYHVRALRAGSGRIQEIVTKMGERITAFLAGR